MKTKDGTLIPCDVKTGDTVLLPEYDGTPVKLKGEEGKEFLLYRNDDLLGILEDWCFRKELEIDDPCRWSFSELADVRFFLMDGCHSVGSRGVFHAGAICHAFSRSKLVAQKLHDEISCKIKRSLSALALDWFPFLSLSNIIPSVPKISCLRSVGALGDEACCEIILLCRCLSTIVMLRAMKLSFCPCLLNDCRCFELASRLSHSFRIREFRVTSIQKAWYSQSLT